MTRIWSSPHSTAPENAGWSLGIDLCYLHELVKAAEVCAGSMLLFDRLFAEAGFPGREVDRWPRHVPPWPHQLATSAAYWSAASSQVEWPMSMILRGNGPSMTRNRIWKDVFSQLITASFLLVSSGPGPEIASLPGSGWEGRARLRQWTEQMARVGRPGLGPDQAGGGARTAWQYPGWRAGHGRAGSGS